MKYAVEVVYDYKDNFDEQFKRITWCKECIGQRGIDWTVNTKRYAVSIFAFKEEAHAALFSLRWL